MPRKTSLCSSLTGNESPLRLCPSGDLRASTCSGQTGQQQRLERATTTSFLLSGQLPAYFKAFNYIDRGCSVDNVVVLEVFR